MQGTLQEGTRILSYLAIGDQLTLQVIGCDAVHGFAKLVDVGTLSPLVAELQFQMGRALVAGGNEASPRRTARLKRDIDAVLQ